MRRISILAVATVLVAGIFINAPASAATDKSGVINSENWEADEGPYRITGPLVVNELTIEEGTEVVVQGDYPITVAGSLNVEGTASEPVIFTFKTETTDGWQGIRFAESQDGSRIEGAEISYARTGVATNRQSWSINQSNFHDNTVGAEITGAPVGDDATGSFDSNYLTDNDTAVKVMGRVSSFELNTVTDNDKGVSFSTTNGSYQDNNLYGNTDYDASSCDFVGTATIDARNNWWGTADEDDIEDDSICDKSDEDASPPIDFGSFELTPVDDAAGPPAPSPSPSVSSSPTTAPVTYHSRALTLRLRRHLRAKGTATVPDGFGACVPPSVTLRFKPRNGAWRDVKTVPVVNGAFSTKLRDRQGMYQATVGQVSTSTYVCYAATSPKVRHAHN